MTILDFKEIAQANKATVKQDEFEFFGRDFLEYLGYKIISGPDRGQDGGRDILALEIRSGVGGETKLVWLVSCKHFAHSSKAVGVDDEKDISDRVKSNKCDGFIGICSTIASSGLTRKLKGWAKQDNKEFQIFDSGKIEKLLFDREEGLSLARRYFPNSMLQWNQQNSSIPNYTVDNQQSNRENIRQQYYEDYLCRKRPEYYEEYIQRKRQKKN